MKLSRCFIGWSVQNEGKFCSFRNAHALILFSAGIKLYFKNPTAPSIAKTPKCSIQHANIDASLAHDAYIAFIYNPFFGLFPFGMESTTNAITDFEDYHQEIMRWKIYIYLSRLRVKTMSKRLILNFSIKKKGKTFI